MKKSKRIVEYKSPCTIMGKQIGWLVWTKEYSAQEVMDMNVMRVLFRKMVNECTSKWRTPIFKNKNE